MQRNIGIATAIICVMIISYADGFSANIEIKTTPAGGYTLYLNDRPFLIKGVIYSPTPAGESYSYNFFSDDTKPWLIDGKLMKEMGINCVRLYAAEGDLEKVKEFVKDMYEQFGIYTILSDWLGLWNYPTANYADSKAQGKTKEKVLKIVEALKDEEGILMWILGNENNYTFSGKLGFWTSPEIEKLPTPCEKIARKAEIYYSFVDDLAAEIKKIDKIHPVALGNGEASSLDIASRVCKNIDLLAIIAYRGKKFGNFFNNLKTVFNKPVLLSEFGCDSFNAQTKVEDQDAQAEFLRSQWQDLYANTVFSGNAEGNCLGAILFEWTDEWWKHNEGYTPDWSIHNTEAGWSDGSYYYDIRAENNLNMNEEWFGLITISEEKDENGINKRIPKKSYYALKEFLLNLPEKNIAP